MRWMRVIAVLALLSPSANAGVTEAAYARAVALIGGLYLSPDAVDATALLHAAAAGLSRDLHWLVIEPEGRTLHVRHGDGRAIGWVSVASLETLPAGLKLLEDLVLDSGGDVGAVDVRLSLLAGLTHALDAHSRVLEGEGLQRFDERLKGTLVGVGASLGLRDERLLVLSVVEGGPAAVGGLRAGDVIVRIDGRATLNMPVREATRLIRGEAGDPVLLAIERDGVALELSLVRAEIVIDNVRHAVLDGGIGYIHISHISQRTLENFVSAIEALAGQSALDRGLVLDLRGNSGGSMKESARAADQFVRSGMLLRTVGPNGDRVSNLQARIDATDAGHLLDAPVVVLVDERTASGAEIIAGALLQLDRAALVGARTYGKGTVQKIYTLDPASRLKLTVAQYLLADDLAIAGVGLMPDVVVATAHLDAYGLRLPGWDPTRQGTTWDAIVPEVRERASWRGADRASIDVAREVARQALLSGPAPTRDATLAAVRAAAASVRAEQHAHLQEALQTQGIAWSPAASAGQELTAAQEAARNERPIDAAVTLSVQPDPDVPEVLLVEVAVTNQGDDPLHQVLVELDCDSLSLWDQIVIPVGLIEPFTTGVGTARMSLPIGVRHREDVVTIRVRADGRPPLDAGEEVVVASSAPMPELSVTARLEAGEDGLYRARLSINNLSTSELVSLDAHFAYPGDTDTVELVDQGARIAKIGPGQSHLVSLAVRLDEVPPPVVPLELVVEASRYGALLDWRLDLPTDGSVLVARAPRVIAPAHPASAPVGAFRMQFSALDERLVAYAVVFHDGKKVGWSEGGAAKVDVTARTELQPGVNRFHVVTVDDHGLLVREQFVVRGEAPVAVDANSP